MQVHTSKCIPKPFPEYRREEKSDLEMEYEARLREMDEKHQHELQELENAYQQKIMGEVERYQVIDAFHEVHTSKPDGMTFVVSRLLTVRFHILHRSKRIYLSNVSLLSCSQALVQERNMQQDRWNEQQQLLVTTHER